MVKKSAACLMLFGFALIPVYAYASCESPDNVKYVSGSEHCLAIKTLSPSSRSKKTLVAAVFYIP